MNRDKLVDTRLDRMIEIADETGLKLDDVVRIMGRCDQRDFEKFSDNPSLCLGKYNPSRSRHMCQ